MKKFKYLFLILIVFIGIRNVKAFDNTLKVYDYAQVLSTDEEESLKKEVTQYIDEYKMDMVLVTVKYHTKNDTKTYAEDFYDYNDFGVGSKHSGIIFVIDFTFGYTDIYISTTGEAIRMYDDSRIESMLDKIADKKDNGYYEMFNAFIKSSSEYAKKGVPLSNINTAINKNGDIVSMPWGIIIAISLIVPTITIIILISKNKMIRKSINANYYVDKNSVVINKRSDMFVTTHTTSVRISEPTSGSGGSTTSRGSSGISHGGGGRRL